jgi:F-type H+-transporting ATPase subunit a
MLFMMLLSCTMATATVSSATQDKKEVDVKQIIFDHVKDSYEWHITTLGDKHVTIPLPIILYSSRTGWDVFSSSVFHEQEEYKGFRIARSGNNEGKIVEVDATETSAGQCLTFRSPRLWYLCSSYRCYWCS